MNAVSERNHSVSSRQTKDWTLKMAQTSSSEGLDSQLPTTPSTSLFERSGLKLALAIAVLRVVFGFLLGHFVLTNFGYLHRLRYAVLSTSTWFGAFDRWDAAYFTSVAQNGYPNGQIALSPFFPGYPLVLRLIHWLTLGHLNYAACGELFSSICLIGSSALMFRLVSRYTSNQTALFAVIFMAWFPTSFFLISPYPESMLILEFLGVIYFLEHDKWLFASLLASIAAVTDQLGVFAVASLAIVILLRTKSLIKSILFAFIGSIGLACYMFLLYVKFHNFLAFVVAEKNWARSSNFPWYGIFKNLFAFTQISSFGSSAPTLDNIYAVWALNDLIAFLGLIIFVFVVIKVAALYREKSSNAGMINQLFPWGVIFLGTLLVPVSSSIYPYAHNLYSTEAEARLISVCVPLYPLTMYLVRKRIWLQVALLGTSVISSIGFQIMFNRGYWLT